MAAEHEGIVAASTAISRRAGSLATRASCLLLCGKQPLKPLLSIGTGCFVDSTVDSIMAAEHKGVIAATTAISGRAGSLATRTFCFLLCGKQPLKPLLSIGTGCFIDGAVYSVVAAEHEGVIAATTAISGRAGSLATGALCFFLLSGHCCFSGGAGCFVNSAINSIVAAEHKG